MTTPSLAEFRARVCALQPGWDAARVSAPQRLPGGYSNANFVFRYDGTPYVLRLVRPGLPGAIARDLEYDLVAHRLTRLTAPLAACGLPGGDLMTRWVDGDLLVDATVGPEHLAAYASALHARLPALRWRHELCALMRRWRDIAAAAGDPVEQRFSRLLDNLDESPRTAPCHNDLNPWNVVVRGCAPRDWCTLDWEWCGGHDPFFDVVTLCAGLGFDAGRTAEVLDRYAVQRGADRPSAVERRDLEVRFHLREQCWARAARARLGPAPALDAQVAASARALDELSG